MGNPAPAVRSVGSTYAEDRMTGRLSYPSVMMGYDFDKWSEGVAVERQTVSFGDYVTGNVFWPKQAAAAAAAATTAAVVPQPLGCVVWLHPYSYATGYYGSYVKGSPIVALVQAGFAVLAYDQVGFASRVRSGGTNFYARHGGDASLFGHMVRDARAAVDFLQCLTKEGRASSARCGTGEAHGGAYPDFLTRIPDIDANKVVLAGYALGGSVALHAAALDDRVKGVASFAGFTPMRSDTNDRATLGLRRLYDFHALLPRLGLFRGDPSRVPYDYDEILGAIKPRPALVFAPRRDRDATFADVQACVEKSMWTGLNFTATEGYTGMGVGEQAVLAGWARRAFA
jgi:pimeloyl-ACP methyl ester carboxylesterase